MRPSKRVASGCKVHQVQGFDLAFCFESRFQGEMIKQQFDIEGQTLAPEIKAGQPHGGSADIWSLGQILYQMLSEPTDSCDRILSPTEEKKWLVTVEDSVKALAVSMTDPDPNKRPSAKQVLSDPWISSKTRQK